MTIHTRDACLKDANCLARISVEGWQDSYADIIDQGTLDSLSITKKTEDWVAILNTTTQTIVAEDHKNIVGFISFGPSHDTGYGQGEVYALYVSGSHQRRGIGQMLMSKAMAIMSKQNLLPVIAIALKGNVPAETFYRNQGFSIKDMIISVINEKPYEEIIFKSPDTKPLLTANTTQT